MVGEGKVKRGERREHTYLLKRDNSAKIFSLSKSEPSFVYPIKWTPFVSH